MNIYLAKTKGPMVLPGYIDPDDVTIIEFFWGAPTFTLDTVYKLGTIVRPAVDNGYYYKCLLAGKSGAVLPEFTTKSMTSGDCKFQAVPYDLFIGFADTILTSTWAVTNGVTLSEQGSSNERTSVKVSLIPALVTSFTLTNQVSKSSGESLSRSILINVNQQ